MLLLVVVVLLLQLLPLLLVGGKLLTGEIVEDGVAARGLVSGWCCYCGCFCRGCCYCRGGGHTTSFLSSAVYIGIL